MAIVLCLVCTVSFGQDRVNRVNPTYESEGYVLKEIFYAFYRNNHLFFIKNQNK